MHDDQPRQLEIKINGIQTVENQIAPRHFIRKAKNKL